MGFSRQEYWSGFHFLYQGIFPTQGSNLHFLHWQMDSLPQNHLGSPIFSMSQILHGHPILLSAKLGSPKLVRTWTQCEHSDGSQRVPESMGQSHSHKGSLRHMFMPATMLQDPSSRFSFSSTSLSCVLLSATQKVLTDWCSYQLTYNKPPPTLWYNTETIFLCWWILWVVN